MLYLNDDSLYKIVEIYINTNIDCKKNIHLIQKLFICTKLWNIYKNSTKLIDRLQCNTINIDDINLKICEIHDNISIEYIDKIIKELKKYRRNMNNNVLKDVILLNHHSLNINKFIHCEDIRQNEKFTNKLLKFYDLKIKRYCCDGNGCELMEIK